MAVAGPSRPPLLTPGLKPPDPGFESWWVRPGALTAVELHGGDRVTVIDPDGGQPAELTATDPGALGERESPIRLFGHQSRPGESQSFEVERDVTLTVAAPGGRVVDGDPPASALVIEIRRATPRPEAEVELPAPLAEPRLDFRVDRASALAYEVREGEFIQIIDVKGQQCSDFLAFHRHKLENGVERGIDGVSTRTLMGAAVPAPGTTSRRSTSTAPSRRSKRWSKNAARSASSTCSSTPSPPTSRNST